MDGDATLTGFEALMALLGGHRSEFYEYLGFMVVVFGGVCLMFLTSMLIVYMLILFMAVSSLITIGLEVGLLNGLSPRR